MIAFVDFCSTHKYLSHIILFQFPCRSGSAKVQCMLLHGLEVFDNPPIVHISML